MAKTNIVYSTEISSSIRDAWNAYKKSLEKPKTEANQQKKFKAYHLFAIACENENKVPSNVADELSNQ